MRKASSWGETNGLAKSGVHRGQKDRIGGQKNRRGLKKYARGWKKHGAPWVL